MTNLIARSYNVESRNILGGHPWLDPDRFDVVAQAPRTTSSHDVRLMLRSMLQPVPAAPRRSIRKIFSRC